MTSKIWVFIITIVLVCICCCPTNYVETPETTTSEITTTSEPTTTTVEVVMVKGHLRRVTTVVKNPVR